MEKSPTPVKEAVVYVVICAGDPDPAKHHIFGFHQYSTQIGFICIFDHHLPCNPLRKVVLSHALVDM